MTIQTIPDPLNGYSDGVRVEKKEILARLKGLSTANLSILWFKTHNEKLLEKREYLINYLTESPRLTLEYLKEFISKISNKSSDKLKVGDIYFIKMICNTGFAKIRKIDGNYSEIEWLTESIAAKKRIDYSVPNGCIYNLKDRLLDKIISFKTSYAPYEIKNQTVTGIIGIGDFISVTDNYTHMNRTIGIGKILGITNNDKQDDKIT